MEEIRNKLGTLNQVINGISMGSSYHERLVKTTDLSPVPIYKVLTLLHNKKLLAKDKKPGRRTVLYSLTAKGRKFKAALNTVCSLLQSP